ncbi:acetylserotonin O-methyltransferase 3-like isoform X2 [Oryza sativa Japonica Group]|uniref:acetylserotonin O-methyltransferase 3-like isoform X2 n=1 Tax=Oryza sativa subsp. japonica TaxID=39947 RepID=UPI0027ACF036|nr:hypothetical protein DAI22_07g133800 [Oryza sativa Japonica Group]
MEHEQLVQASTELMHHSLGYVRSMALGCAAKLGVADAIHRAGGRATLHDLHAALSLHPTKLPFLRRVMRVLVASGVFAQVKEEEDHYRLTPVSSLLVTAGRTLLPFVLLQHSPLCVTPATSMAEWLKTGEEETAFEMAHGAGLWGACRRAPELGDFFNDAMAADSAFIMDAAIRGARQVFDKITSLVDVAGGTGAAARAVAAAFPHIKCTVLDLPHVIDSIPVDHGDVVQFVAGDMMDFIPQADALLLKTLQLRKIRSSWRLKPTFGKASRKRSPWKMKALVSSSCLPSSACGRRPSLPLFLVCLCMCWAFAAHVIN